MTSRVLRITAVVAIVGLVGGWLSRAHADEPLLLKYKAIKGDKLIYKTTMDLKQLQSIMGTKIENTIKQETIVSRVVVDATDDGNVTLKVKTDRRKMNAEFGAQGKFDFDSKSSERDTGSAIGASVTPLLERLTGSEYELRMSPRGQITDVKGYAELLGDLLKDNLLAQQFGAADNKSAAIEEQRGFLILSEKPVAPGDQWEVPLDVELTNVGKIKGKQTYTFEGVDKVGDRKTVRVRVDSDFALELKIDQPGAKVTGTLSTSSSSGTAQFDPEAGRVVSIKQKSTLSGRLMVEAGGMMIPIDNEQEQSDTLELLDKLPE